MATAIKGDPVWLYQQQGTCSSKWSDIVLDCANYNALSLSLTWTNLRAQSENAQLELFGSHDNGIYVPIVIPSYSHSLGDGPRARFYYDTAIDVPFGFRWLKARLTVTGGAFVDLIAAPYVSSGPIWTVPMAARLGGAGLAKSVDVGGTPVLHEGIGTLYGLQIANYQAAAAYVQIFDKINSNVVLGTTVPDLQVVVAANSFLTVPVPAVGMSFEVGLTLASTTAAGGSTGSAAGVAVYTQFGQ